MEQKQEAINDFHKPADALLVVDVQNAFVEGPDAVPGHATLTSAVEVLLEKARSAWAPVIFLQNDGPPGAPDEPLQAGWKLHFPPRSGELVIRKTEDNGFDGTDLDAILAAFGVHDLAICGMLSEMCLAATARSALQRGYGVLLPHDAHATYDVPAGRDRKVFLRQWRQGLPNGRSATRSAFAPRRTTSVSRSATENSFALECRFES